ncbi:hypothetical protein [Echinicola shivajiensis]|uniref:hypothetical protein n=1 Tax=Echinicola shivajiensis TaxID=1035916 RepID=UPI001FEA96CF|nr:hypothetical protein [Echinicola shivajiensis]
MLKPFYIFLLVFPAFLSCETQEKKSSQLGEIKKASTIRLEILDSVQIHLLGLPVIHDIDPKTETIIFTDDSPNSEEIQVADFDGNIHASFSKLGDIPDGYGGLMSPLRIDSDSSFLAYGYNGFLRYDFAGNLLSKVKHKDFEYYNFSNKTMGFGMEKLGNRYIYYNQGSGKVDYTSLESYKEMTLMNWLDPEKGEKEPFISFPEGSLFRNGKHFFRDSWAPAYTSTDDRIYIVFGIEPVIYEFEAKPPYTLISSIPIELPNYRYFKGGDLKSTADFVGLFLTTGRIYNIKKIDDQFLVAYFPGYDAQDRETSESNKTPEEAKLFRERMAKKYSNHIAVFDTLGNRLNDFIPKDLRANSMLVRDGQIWMQEKPDPEVEKDYFTIYKVGLKDDN